MESSVEGHGNSFMAQMRICFIGDSFVSGAYDGECLGWVGRISAAARRRGHDVSVYNLGIRGETSVQIARRWRTEAEVRQSPQQEGRLVFEFGVNDVRELDGKRQLQLPPPRERCLRPPCAGNLRL